MRCIGADNPPCMRCAKVNRNCVVPNSHRLTHTLSPELHVDENATSDFHGSGRPSHLNDSSEVRQDSIEFPLYSHRLETGELKNPQTGASRSNFDGTAQSSGHVKIMNLPSVYMTSPLGTIDAQLNANPVPDDHSRPDLLNQSTSTNPSSALSYPDILPNDLLKLLQ